MPDRTNEAWRAYALMIWPKLSTFGRDVPILDDEGNPALDEDGKPKTERKAFSTKDMTDWTIIEADALYAAELAAEERRAETGDKTDDAE